MRITQLTAAQRELLQEVAGRISPRLAAQFTDLGDDDGPNIGVELRERGCSVVTEVPGQLVEGACADPVMRHTFQLRIKARRDRMLFRPPPDARLPRVESAPPPGGGFGMRGQGRGRR